MNPLALLVAPLAGIALLSAAAAVALNPVLINISTTNGRRRRRRRRRRDAEENELEVQAKVEEFKVSEENRDVNFSIEI